MTTKYYLDTRVAKEGTAPLKYSISSNNHTTYITTDIRLLPENWDQKKQQVVGGAGKQLLNLRLVELKLKYDKYLEDLREQGELKGLSVQQVRDLLLHKFYDTSSGEGQVLKALNKHYENLSAASQSNLKTLLIHIRNFDEQFDSRDFISINKEYLRKFLEYMEKRMAVNSAINNILTLHPVFAEALDDDIIGKDPFRGLHLVKTPTRKRCMDDENLVKLWLAEPANKGDLVIQDMFKLSFLLIGMNIVDLLKINRDPLNQISNGRIEYNRSKTSRPYSIKIEPEAKVIMDRHKGKNNFLDFQDRYVSAPSTTAASHRHLKNLCAIAGIPRVTMYYARHTWATLAHRIGISKDDISLSLGHSFGISTTDIYIDYNSDRIDAANRKVIDHLNKLIEEYKTSPNHHD